MPFVNVKQTKYHYEIFGKGTPILLIAGYTRDYTAWAFLKDKLAQRFQLCVIDNRGVGQTVDNNEPLSAEIMADDMIEMMAALKIHKPHIVGQSMGGTIAQAIASKYPEQISKLCLIATSCKWRTAMLKGLGTSLAMRERGLDFDFIFNANIPWIYGEKFLSNLEKISQVKKAILSNPYPQSLSDQKRQFEVLVNFDARNYLKNIKARTLVGYGKEDIISLPQESEFLKNSIADSTLVAFDAGHGVLIEDPAALSQELIAFLKAL